MLTIDRKQLVLLHPVKINRDVAKWKGAGKNQNQAVIDNMMKRLEDNLNLSFQNHSEVEYHRSSQVIYDGIPFAYRRTFQEGWKRTLMELYIRARLVYLKWFGPKFLAEEEFFNNVKNSVKELQSLEKWEIEHLKKELNELYDIKQKRLFASLASELSIAEAESKILEGGFTKYFDEEDIIKFTIQAEAGITLMPIDGFPYSIPKEVMDKLDKAEELKVFDNYYILYMSDKDKVKEVQKTPKTEVKKDPILFGVMDGSTKLYFIGDWLTDYCKINLEYLKEQGFNTKTLTN